MKRSFLNVANVEVEVCEDKNKTHFVRHHTYWWIAHAKRNPDPVYNCIVGNLEIMTNNRLQTIKWVGHDFQFEKVAFEDGMEVETVLIPLSMFEDFIRY